MHRSSSTSRASDEFYVSFSPASVVSLPKKFVNSDGLPLSDPNSEATKKEVGMHKSGENLIHLIPLILLLCGFILWIFSHPGKVWWLIGQPRFVFFNFYPSLLHDPKLLSSLYEYCKTSLFNQGYIIIRRRIFLAIRSILCNFFRPSSIVMSILMLYLSLKRVQK